MQCKVFILDWKLYSQTLFDRTCLPLNGSLQRCSLSSFSCQRCQCSLLPSLALNHKIFGQRLRQERLNTVRSTYRSTLKVTLSQADAERDSIYYWATAGSVTLKLISGEYLWAFWVALGVESNAGYKFGPSWNRTGMFALSPLRFYQWRWKEGRQNESTSKEAFPLDSTSRGRLLPFTSPPLLHSHENWQRDWRGKWK